MFYISTRSDNEKLASAEAIKKGIATDGGLFVPSEIPGISVDEIEALAAMPYKERAYTILSKFLTDYSEEEIRECINGAYDTGFDSPDIAPVRTLKDGISCLELWHGPTSAFKDMALQILPHFLVKAISKTGEKDRIIILTATSGDTGKAALEGFKDVDGTGIMVFYPVSGVSNIQKRQMSAQEGDNVSVMSVEGNFDDAQTGVKKIFADRAFADELSEKGFKLSSANSINWGRLVPQIVYYFSGYADMIKNGEIKAGDEIVVTVPTGNFGNILAGYIAMKMGLPVKRFVCASNSNKILTDFFRTGVYDRNRDFLKTASPSMDILISSNLERLLYFATGSHEKVSGWMNDLNTNGRYEIDADTFESLNKIFYGNWASEEETLDTIARQYSDEDYLIDTHTAVAFAVAHKYRQDTGDDAPMLVVSTASPYKFCDSVNAALRLTDDTATDTAMYDTANDINSIFGPLDRLNEATGVKIPEGLDNLRTKDVRFREVCGKEQMTDAVRAFLKAQC